MLSQVIAQILDLQNKVNSLSNAREFDDLDTASSSGATHVPSQPLIAPSPSRGSRLPLDTQY